MSFYPPNDYFLLVSAPAFPYWIRQRKVSSRLHHLVHRLFQDIPNVIGFADQQSKWDDPFVRFFELIRLVLLYKPSK